jgi:cytochrome c biogenesis protein CcdA
MKNLPVWIVDEKVILPLFSFIFALMAIIIAFFHLDKEYVMYLFGFSNILLGALLRGLTHTPQSNADQDVVTTVTPKVLDKNPNGKT